jgi:hypothetical protein
MSGRHISGQDVGSLLSKTNISNAKNAPRNSSAGWVSTSSSGAVQTAEKSGKQTSCINVRQRLSNPAIFDIRPRGVMNSTHCTQDSSLELLPRSHGEARSCNRKKINARLAIDKTKEKTTTSCARARRRVPCGSVEYICLSVDGTLIPPRPEAPL